MMTLRLQDRSHPEFANSKLQVVVQVLGATAGHLDNSGMWCFGWTATAREFHAGTRCGPTRFKYPDARINPDLKPKS